MGHLKGSNCKIARVITDASLPTPGQPGPDASIMRLTAFRVRFVAANFMIDGAEGCIAGAGHGSVVTVWAGVSGSGVVGGTLGVESLAGGWRCIR